MSDTNKYLDYEGLRTYHDELVSRLADLEYDPSRLFDEKIDLFDKQKWGSDKYGRVAGLKEGLMITVGNQIWQLVNPVTFNTVLSRVQPASEKALIPTEDLGWKVIGNNVDFDIANHVLHLTK